MNTIRTPKPQVHESDNWDNIAAKTQLKRKLRRAERARNLRYMALIAPLALLILVNFIVPIAMLLKQSVSNPEVVAAFPHTIAALTGWKGQHLPDEKTYAALVKDLTADKDTIRLAMASKRLNMEELGFRSLLMRTVQHLPSLKNITAKKALIKTDAKWGQIETWQHIARNRSRWTDFYLLKSIDLKVNTKNTIVNVSPDKAIFRTILARTFWMSFVVTVICILLGFPLAYLIASQPPRIANPMLIFVLLPFWTSILVRIAAWIVLLQHSGLVNRILIDFGIVDKPLQLVFNRIGVYIAMVHILLPFAILPMYSVMKGIPPSLKRAALSLGCPPFKSFWKIYFPLTLPGVGAGALLVFIISMGYYITPALLGGAKDQMLSYFIAFFINQTINWGMAAALSAVLLVSTLLLYIIYFRYFNPVQTEKRS